MVTKTIIQFGVKHKDISTLGDIPYVDCRVLPNPYVKGVSDEVLKNRIKGFPEFKALVSKGEELLRFNDTIAVFCLYGIHRSGAVAEELARLFPGSKILKADCYV